jgi:hypothetical protein
MAINEFDQYMLNGLLNKQFQELQKDGLKIDLGAVYNGMVLGYAVDAARRGDSGAVEDFVNSIGNVLFPTEGVDDPMWPNAAKAAFKRSVFGLIDYYMEEDREMYVKAFYEQWNPDMLSQRLDELWSHVTLYNVCEMMTQLASKASNDVDFIHTEEDDSSDEKDYLTLFFDATNALPTNKLRRAIQNQDNMLRAMAGSEKTIASVYRIVLTMMRFFTANSSDVRANQLDFIKMVFKRVLQARKVKYAIRSYKVVYHKTDDDISRLDSEKFAKNIMAAVNEMIVADSKLCMRQELRDAVSELDAAFESDGIVDDDIVEPDDIIAPDDMDDIVDMESQFLSDDLEANADLQKVLDENGRIVGWILLS